MNTLQEATIKTIQNLPDSCTLDDIMYEINFVAQVYEGLEDSRNGKVISTDELLKKVDSWSR